MKKNKVLEKLYQGKPAIGCQIRSRSPMVAEIYGICGFDFAFIEGEHFPYNIESVLNIVQACECGGIEPFARIPDHDPAKILQYLDMGVTGLLLPHCDTGAQARAIMGAGKYAPQGERGFSNTSRATGYGTLPMDDYKRLANQNTLLIPFIESREAVEHLDEILDARPDALHIGPGDLSESYNCPISDSYLDEIMETILKKATAVGVPVAAPAADVQDAVAYIKKGFKIISFSSDLMLLRAAGSKAVADIREELGI